MLQRLVWPRNDDQLALARRSIQAGDHRAAAVAARNVLRSAPTAAEAHHLLARSLLGQGRLDEASKSVEEALRLAPGYAEAHHTLAQCEFKRGANEVAIASVKTAIALVPDYVEAHFTLGTVLHKLGKLEDAEASFRHAIGLKADYAEALNQLGVVLQDQGRLAEAEAVLQRAVTSRPDYANAHDNLGFVLRQIGRPDEAAASFKRAHALFEPHLVLHQPDSHLSRSLENARRFARVTSDIVRWNAAGSCRPNAWTDYRLLHQATNGSSSDLFSRFLANLPGKRGREPDPWRDSPIFPWISQSDVPSILQSLDRDGLYVFDRPIASDILDEAMEYGRTTPAALYPVPPSGQTRAVFDPVEPLASGYQFDEAQILEKPVFQRFMGDPLLLAISQAYLGVEPRLAYLALWWSAVFERNPTSDMAQLFHADLAHIKWLKFFVYLTDVSEGTGPHSFVRGSHKPDVEGWELRRRGLVRLSDEDIYRAYAGDRIVDLVGPRGTVFIADTRGFHKGHLPRTGHRLVLQVYHVNSLFPDAVAKNKRRVIPVDPNLLDSIRRHPDTFAGYRIGRA